MLPPYLANGPGPLPSPHRSGTPLRCNHSPLTPQIAGFYPGVTAEEIASPTSVPAAELGQWSYDFSDPDGPQLGTVAVESGPTVRECSDPVVIIAGNVELGVSLPKGGEEVELLVLVDRGEKGFKERVFLVLDTEEGVRIRAYNAVAEMEPGAVILGRVIVVKIPWLPYMKPTKSGFAEADEYF